MSASTECVILDMMDISRILDILTIVRKVWRRQGGNQKPQIKGPNEKEQTTIYKTLH